MAEAQRRDELKFKELLEHHEEILLINGVASLLHWDQATYLPEGGSETRSKQLALIGVLSKEKFASPELRRLTEELLPWAKSQPLTDPEAQMVIRTHEDIDFATRIPIQFTKKAIQHFSQLYQRWTRARAENNFGSIQSDLEKSLELSREAASYFPEFSHPGDYFIHRSDEGMNVESIRSLFANLRSELVPLVNAIDSLPPLDDSVLRQEFDTQNQLRFSEFVTAKLGYSFENGRQDLTHHPFMTRIGQGDIRITTRVDRRDFGEALSSSVHEAGHALYEQGIDPNIEGSLLGAGVSAGIHESQSRLWENIVGRSLPFWEYFLPFAKERFPKELLNTTPRALFEAMNRVKKGLIRTGADEVTYNLHVMIRFEIEMSLLEGNLKIKDLPEAWNEAYRQNLGISPQTDSEGVMQDVHWYYSSIGGRFQGYTLGNLMSAQFFEAAERECGEFSDRFRAGDFSDLREWLRKNVHAPGRQYRPNELLKRATGSEISTRPFMNYLCEKFSELYGEDFSSVILSQDRPASPAQHMHSAHDSIRGSNP